jgi:hypothetical protein
MSSFFPYGTAHNTREDPRGPGSAEERGGQGPIKIRYGVNRSYEKQYFYERADRS